MKDLHDHFDAVNARRADKAPPRSPMTMLRTEDDRPIDNGASADPKRIAEMLDAGSFAVGRVPYTGAVLVSVGLIRSGSFIEDRLLSVSDWRAEINV